MDVKICSDCGIGLSLESFSVNRAKKDGLQQQCKKCRNLYNKKWRKENKKGARDYRLKRKFDITVEQYNEMFIEQHGVCAICCEPERTETKDGKKQWLAVDHNHKTGVVRGLLCSNCNTGLGLLGDSTELLKSAIKYLTKRGSYGK